MKAPKVKLKFDAKAIQTWFIANVEKLLFGVFALVMLYYIYGAATRETFDKGPTDLQAAVSRAQKNIADGDANLAERTKEITPADFSRLVPARNAVEDLPSLPKLWSPEVIPRDRRRGTPNLLPVRELQVAADYGAMRWRGDPPTRGFSWIVVTGIVPYAEQVDEYLKAFMLADTKGASDDAPVYEQYVVERGEVKTDDPNEPVTWKPLATWPLSRPVKGIVPLAPWLAQNRWDATAQDPVPNEFLLPNTLTDPLGPLVDKSWSNDVGHAKFPLPKIDAPPPPEATLPGDEPGAEGEEMAPLDGEPAADAEAPADEAPADEPPADEPPGADAGMPGAISIVEQQKLDEARRYRLFRFFDFRAEVGKRYRYRVKLALQNPNFDVSEIACKPDANTKDLTLTTDFSEPSPVASVRRFNNVLVGGVKTARGEPLVTAIVRQFDIKTGLERYTEKNEKSKSQQLVRGQLANFRETVKNGDRDVTIDFQTNMMLADALGGERLSYAGNQSSLPAITAWLDDAGRLVVQTETHDSLAYREAAPKIGGDESGSTGPAPRRELSPSSGAAPAKPGGSKPNAPSKPGANNWGKKFEDLLKPAVPAGKK